MSFRLGLTGSIGMGKSTTARMFKEQGCAVWDADQAVHRLYGKGGAAVEPLQALFPDCIEEGAVSRDKLRKLIASDPSVLGDLEKVVHPLVRFDREEFASNADEDIIVFDIPLLFETGGNSEMDATACVTVPRETQIERVMARGTMSRDDLETILARQMPNTEKCLLADFVIDTDTLEAARLKVDWIVRTIREGSIGA